MSPEDERLLLDVVEKHQEILERYQADLADHKQHIERLIFAVKRLETIIDPEHWQKTDPLSVT